jgi:hypothetical protein
MVGAESAGVVQQPERVIALDKWEEGDACDTPGTAALPSTWGTLAYAVDTAIEAGGSGVAVNAVGGERLELHITSVREVGQVFSRSTVTIAFNRTDASTGTSDAGVEESSLPTATGVNELKFRFKNALVYVNNPAPPLPSPPKPAPPISPMKPEPTPEPLIFDDDSDGDDELVALVQEEVVPAVEEVRPRPTTAVVRIVLREPTPPPPPIDFDAKATILQVKAGVLNTFHLCLCSTLTYTPHAQMMVRRRHKHKTRLVIRLQRAVRRSRRVYLWQELVYNILEIAHDAATIVQC